MAARKTSTTKRKWNPYKNGGVVKRAKGNLRAAKRGTDSADFVVKFTHSFPLLNYNDGVKDYNGYILNVWDLLSRAPNFEKYASLYDQVKINGVQIKLASANSFVNTASTHSVYDIYTAIDHNGLDTKFIKAVGQVNAADATKSDITGFRTCINEAIATYASSSRMQLNPFQRWAQNRSIYPSSMQEKSQFVSTEACTKYHDNFDTSDKYFPLIQDYKTVYSSLEPAKIQTIFEKEFLNIDNPGILTSNAKYPFKPTLYINAFTTGATQNNEVSTFEPLPSGTVLYFNADISVSCTFRGPKGTPTV